MCHTKNMRFRLSRSLHSVNDLRMKTLLLFALLAFGFCQGASKAAKSSGALSFVNRRKLPALESALDLVPVGVVDEKALTENSAGPVTCTPARNLDFDFGRAGTISVVRYDTTAFECANHCRQGDEDTCVGFNYFRLNRTCHELKSIGVITSAPTLETMTSVLSFSDGGGCSEHNFLKDCHRAGSDYKRLSVSSAVECCISCAAESNRCRAWDYDTGRGHCYLKDIVPLLRTWGSGGQLVTGLGCAAPCIPTNTSM